MYLPRILIIPLISLLVTNDVQPLDMDSKVFIVVLEGVRHDFFKVSQMPNLVHLSLRGVRADRLKPVYPPLSWPATTSILTGVYPETHGVVYNAFYDPKFQRTFNASTDSYNPLVFQVPPITVLNGMMGGKTMSIISRGGCQIITFVFVFLIV